MVTKLSKDTASNSLRQDSTDYFENLSLSLEDNQHEMDHKAYEFVLNKIYKRMEVAGDDETQKLSQLFMKVKTKRQQEVLNDAKIILG